MQATSILQYFNLGHLMNKPLPSGTANVFPVRNASCSVDHGHNGVKVDNQRKDKGKR
jgi:hypothetical protein